MIPMLQFINVSKSFPTQNGASRLVLDGVSVSVERGRKIALVGRSGSGKSTFLHLAAGIESISQGQVLVDGENIAEQSESQRTRWRRDHVGLIFQFFHLLPNLSVAENVALPNLIAGVSTADSASRVNSLLGTVGLAARSGDNVQKLSGGEMQRVALCRALLRKPALLLADEPTGSLDDENSQAVMKLLFQMSDENGSALIYATHSQELAAMADEEWTIHNGRIERA